MKKAIYVLIIISLVLSIISTITSTNNPLNPECAPEVKSHSKDEVIPSVKTKNFRLLESEELIWMKNGTFNTLGESFQKSFDLNAWSAVHCIAVTSDEISIEFQNQSDQVIYEATDYFFDYIVKKNTNLTVIVKPSDAATNYPIDYNFTFIYGSIPVGTNEGISNRNIWYSGGEAFTLLNYTDTELWGLNVSTVSGEDLEQFSYQLINGSTDDTLVDGSGEEESYFVQEFAALQDNLILVSIKAVDAPTKFPASFSWKFWKEESVHVNENIKINGTLTHPQDRTLYKLNTTIDATEVAFRDFFENTNWRVFNASGSVNDERPQTFYAFVCRATPSTPYYLEIESRTWNPSNDTLSYSLQIRVAPPIHYFLTYTGFEKSFGTFIYPEDTIYLQFLLGADYQVRFTEMNLDNRQEWTFRSVDTGSIYWQNWRISGILREWKGQTLHHIAETDGSYELAIQQRSGLEYNVTRVIHDTRMPESQTIFTGSLYTDSDFEFWKIELKDGESISISYSGVDSEQWLITETYNEIAMSNSDGLLEYHTHTGGIYYYRVKSSGNTGSYTLRVTRDITTEAAPFPDLISGIVVLIGISIIIIVVLIGISIKRHPRNQS